MPRIKVGGPHKALDSQIKALIGQLDECGPILDKETEKYVW